MASSEEIRVSIEALNGAIKDFESKRDSMENTYLKISNVIRELNTTWRGSSANKFSDQFDALYKNLSQTREQMDNAISKLEQARNIYQETEEAVKAMTEQLEAGDTPTFF